MNIDETLKRMSIKIISDMKAIIVKNNRRASGKLLNSITYKINKSTEGKYLSLDFYSETYGIYVDKGRGATHGGGGGGKKLVERIEEWLKVKRIPLRNNKTGKVIRGRGVKRDALIKGAAYAIARSIHKKGWKTPPNPHGAINFTQPLNDNVQNVCDQVYFYYAEKAKEALKNEFKK